MNRLAMVASAALVLSSARTGAADPAPKRKIAVLEYRSASSALTDVGKRVAAILAASTSLDVDNQDDARRKFGAALDADLARCGGDPTCVAEIGKTLGVADVVLVGVAEFGDIILTIQRIEASSSAVASRLAEALPPDGTVTDANLEAFVRRVMPRIDFLRYGVIRINSDIGGALVHVGGTRRGTTPLQPLKLLAPATYEIRVSKDGYSDFRAEVIVPPDAEVVVNPDLSLRSADPAPAAWYTKWWVLTVAGAVVAGAVTTAVFVTRDKASRLTVDGEFVPQPVMLRF